MRAGLSARRVVNSACMPWMSSTVRGMTRPLHPLGRRGWVGGKGEGCVMMMICRGKSGEWRRMTLDKLAQSHFAVLNLPTL